MITLAEIQGLFVHNNIIPISGPSAQMETEDPCSGAIYLTVRTAQMERN